MEKWIKRICDNKSFLISFFSKIIQLIKNYIKNFRLKKVMGFKNKKVLVSFSIFSSEIINSSLHELVTIKCLENVKDVIDIGKRIGVEVDILTNSDVGTLSAEQINDEIHIGGPLTNNYVHSYLNKFNGFTFYSKKVKKTIHIVFNTHYSKKVNVLMPFIEYPDLLYNKIKEYKHNYFLVIPIDRNTGIFEMDKIEDKTNKFNFF